MGELPLIVILQLNFFEFMFFYYVKNYLVDSGFYKYD